MTRKQGRRKRASSIDSTGTADGSALGSTQPGQSKKKKTDHANANASTTADAATAAGNLLDDVINRVALQAPSVDVSDDGTSQLDIRQLVARVNDQEATIHQLTQQVLFLLSYLGLQNGAGKPSAGTSSSSLPAVASAAALTSSSSTAAASGQSMSSPTSQSVSYSNVTARRPMPLSSAMNQAVVSAVYRDLKEKDRRARNVVVSGLATSADDVSSVKKLLTDEFQQHFDVVKCRRLGRQQDGRIQPLLVTLDTETQATFVTRSARLLRQSNNEAVRSSIYINADLTRAEAFSAYQTRCDRRRRVTRQPPSSGAQLSPPSAPPPSIQLLQPPSSAAQSPAADATVPINIDSPVVAAAAADPATVSNAVASNLQPSAQPFVPASAVGGGNALPTQSPAPSQ